MKQKKQENHSLQLKDADKKGSAKTKLRKYSTTKGERIGQKDKHNTEKRGGAHSKRNFA